jgi:2-oxoisovalerate dehydrogenase E2 component (dihydrolipoyl transacylase)
VKTVSINMPQLGESVHEGTIARWLVKPGDQIAEFEPMLEVETDKVSTEVPSPVTGVVEELIAGEGQTVPVGAAIAKVSVTEDGHDQEKPPEQPLNKTQAMATSAGSIKPSAPAGPAVITKGATGSEAASTSDGRGASPNSPAVRALAKQHNLDLSQVHGTGIAGRVTRADVERYVEAGTAVAVPRPAAAPIGHTDRDEAVPLSRVRRLIAENMTRSKQTIPHAWQTQEVDMSGVVSNRSANKAEFQRQEGFSLTYLPYVVKAAAAALSEHRGVNATFNQTEIIIHRDINIGVSIGLEDTLLVPVLRGVDGLSIAGIARGIADLVERAHSRKLTTDDLQGATFTVNNSGTFGTLFSYSVIIPGQSGILTMEAIVDRPVAVKGMIGVRPLMYLCFSLDHRVIDGMQAARFLTSCRQWLEQVTTDFPIY